MKSAEEIKEFWKNFKTLDREHWKKLDKFGYVDFPESDIETCWAFMLEDNWWQASHEQNDFVPLHSFIQWLLEEKI